ncbi:hypothetical protein [Polaribacter sp. IC073]|nr:hypothetical protein [Polaribacter sp. IC073]
MLTVTYQIGTDIIGQPMYRTHFVSANNYLGSKESISVEGITHR